MGVPENISDFSSTLAPSSCSCLNSISDTKQYKKECFLIYKFEVDIKYDKQQQTTTIELEAPDFFQKRT